MPPSARLRRTCHGCRTGRGAPATCHGARCPLLPAVAAPRALRWWHPAALGLVAAAVGAGSPGAARVGEPWSAAGDDRDKQLPLASPRRGEAKGSAAHAASPSPGAALGSGERAGEGRSGVGAAGPCPPPPPPRPSPAPSGAGGAARGGEGAAGRKALSRRCCCCPAFPGCILIPSPCSCPQTLPAPPPLPCLRPFPGHPREQDQHQHRPAPYNPAASGGGDGALQGARNRAPAPPDGIWGALSPPAGEGRSPGGRIGGAQPSSWGHGALKRQSQRIAAVMIID